MARTVHTKAVHKTLGWTPGTCTVLN